MFAFLWWNSRNTSLYTKSQKLRSLGHRVYAINQRATAQEKYLFEPTHNTRSTEGIWLGLGLQWRWRWEGAETRGHQCLDFQANLISKSHLQHGACKWAARKLGWSGGGSLSSSSPSELQNGPGKFLGCLRKEHETKGKAGHSQISSPVTRSTGIPRQLPARAEKRGGGADGESWTSLNPWVNTRHTERTWLTLNWKDWCFPPSAEVRIHEQS